VTERDAFAFQGTELPKQVEDAVKSEEWTARALAKATDPPRESEPENETSAQRFMRRLGEQREAEDRHEDIVRRAQFENPAPPVADPLRDLTRAQQRERVWRRRRGRIPR
jgi:hypothetical protein